MPLISLVNKIQAKTILTGLGKVNLVRTSLVNRTSLARTTPTCQGITNLVNNQVKVNLYVN